MLRSDTIDNSIRVEFFYDHMSYLVAYVEIDGKEVIPKTYVDLKYLTAPEMRDLWVKLKIDLLPPQFMEHIRAATLTHLQNIGRADLVAVCLDSPAPQEGVKRL